MSHFPSDRSDPVSDPDFSTLWSALRAPGFADELVGGRSTVAMLIARGSVTAGPVQARRSRLSNGVRVRIAAVGLAAAFAASSGLTYAGALPGAAQPLASTVLARVGVTVPGHHENAGTHPDRQRGSASATSVSHPSPNHGTDVSTLARSTTLTGRAKGMAIAAAASDGRSVAGQANAAARSGGHSTSGQQTAATKSGGRSSQGQGHRPSRVPTAPHPQHPASH